MKIDLLYFDGCPSWLDALENLEAALKAEGLEAGIRLVKVTTDNEAVRLMFSGSPSFRVDGVDWWPDERKCYHMSCRVYQTPVGLKGAPTIEMLRDQLHQHDSKQ